MNHKGALCDKRGLMSEDSSSRKDSSESVINVDKVDVLPAIDEKASSSSLSKLPAKRSEAKVTKYRPDKVGDPLTQYLKEISRYPLLSLEQEKELTTSLAKTGDVEIAKELVLANLRLVVKISMEYRNAYQNIMDLIQEGNMGLMKAVSKYDGTKGAKLSYYASWWIRSYILKFILDNFHLVKIGTTNDQKKLFYNLLNEKNKLVGMGLDPSPKLLSENLGVSEKSVILMDQRLGTGGGEVSLDATRTLSGEETSSTLMDSLPDSSQEAVDDVLAREQSLKLLKNHLNDFLGNLKERDQEIFKKRLLSEIPPSLQALADQYGVSRERIRQIEERLLKNLKVYMSEIIK